MDCSKCAEMELKYMTWGSGACSPILWCNYYKIPCIRALKHCEIRVLDEKLYEKAMKALKIGSFRRDNYEEKRST